MDTAAPPIPARKPNMQQKMEEASLGARLFHPPD